MCVCESYRPSRVAIFDLEVGHGFGDGHDGLDGVAEDHSSVLPALVL